MQKRIGGVLGLAVLLGMFSLLGETQESAAGVELNINIGPLPAFVVPSPPPMVVIPGTYVYVAPDIGVDILFYHGSWYRPHEGRWYGARSYNGPWVYLAPARVPRVLLELPPGYRRVPPGYRRITYGDMQKNWKRWERERYWHKDRGWREGGRERPEGRGGEERGRGHEGHGGHEGRRG